MYCRLPHNQSGLTLIESLIVVILLGIVAAAAVPRFPSTPASAIHDTLQSNTQTLQRAIALYAIQHNGIYPGQVRHTDGFKARTAEEARVAIVAQLLLYSDANGRTSSTRDSDHPFGPYLPEGIPINPLPPQSSDILATFDDSEIEAREQAGWKLSLPSGTISPIYPARSDQ